MRSIYDFTDYKEYLNDALDERGKGARSDLAKAADCQSGYVTHVLSGHAHFSLEQGERIATHLGLDEPQTQYFLDLISYGRAGTETLRRRFRRTLDAQKEKHSVLKTRLKVEKSLSIEDQAIFYSSWHYGAVHVSVSVPGCDTERGLSEYLKIPIGKVNQIVQFLERTGLILREDSRLKIGSTQIYIGSDSPLISKFHTNWRLRAIDSFDRYTERDLHYSSVITCSRQDAALIRETLVQAIEKIRPVIRASKDEACFSYSMDLFEL